jgi:parvulin-like peptidyl-prolyl isomerase
MTSKTAGMLIAAAGLLGPLGCGASGPRPLTAEAFLPKPSPAAEVTRADPPPNETPKLVPPTTHPVEALIAAPATQADPPAPLVLRDGTFMTLGGVVADVNGTPVYANKILSLLDKEFAAKAREMDADRFREFARHEVERQRQELIADEVEYAAAQRELGDDDKKLVDALTMQYRQKTVIEAGGSVELAKRKAITEGTTFDEMVQQQNRRIMRDLFYQRRILPRIQVTADDMRQFYKANVDKLYSQQAQAQFRVIKIDPQRIGGDDPRAAAIKEINYIRAKALRGDDFAALASAENHDDYLKSRGGDPGGWIKRNSYLVDAVEKAVWALEPGQITGVIEANGAFYIAKLEAKKPATVRPFEDQTVQDDIQARLRQAQFANLRDKVRTDLETGAAITANDAQLDLMVEMAMQKYPRWAQR